MEAMEASDHFQQLKRFRSVAAALLFGSQMRGDANKNSDYDIALFVEGNGYLTDDDLYSPLAKIPFDITIFTLAELDGVVSLLYKLPAAYHLVNEGKLLFGDTKIVDKLSSKIDCWEAITSREYLSDLSFMLSRSRRYNYQILSYLGYEGLTKSVEDRIKSCSSNLRAALTYGLALKCQPTDLGKKELVEAFANEFDMRRPNFSEEALAVLTGQVSIQEKIYLSRQLIELASEAVNEYLCANG